MTLGEILNLDPAQVAGMSLDALSAAVTAALALPVVNLPENKAIKDALTVLAVALQAIVIATQVYSAIQALIPEVERVRAAAEAIPNPTAIPKIVQDTLKDIAQPLLVEAKRLASTNIKKLILETEIPGT